MSQYAGYGQKEKVRPAFTVEPMEGTFKHTIAKRTEKGLRFEEVEKPCKYLVKFPKYGNSIHVSSDEELMRLGFHQAVPLVDDDGEVVSIIENPIKLTKKG